MCRERHQVFDYILARVDENLATDLQLSQFEYMSVFELGSDDLDSAFFDVVTAEWLDIESDDVTQDIYDYASKRFKYHSNEHGVVYFKDNGELERNFYEDEWARFVDGIHHSHRFFNPKAKDFLDSVFGFASCDAGNLKTECVRAVKQGEYLYRARTAQSYADGKKLKDDPCGQFGPPPMSGAGSQRMTPSGIAAMYCGFDRQTCLSEIRAITGDQIVSVALTPTKTLNLLDLSRLPKLEMPKLTWLDEGYLRACQLHTFLNSLVKKMSKPRGRNDELSYLSTQVVFEYLRLKFTGQIDGLVFPSVQTGEKGMNAVLFPECSVVSRIKYSALELDEIFGPPSEKQMAHEDSARLMYVERSMVFHKITSIETHSKEYESISDFYMDDLTRRRFGFS